MFLKWPLIGGLLLVLIARWWAKRSARFRWGALIVGWLAVAAQAVSAGRQTWGHPPEPTGAVLGAWLILAMLGGVLVWLQWDTRPEPAANDRPGRSARSGAGGGSRRTRRSDSAARSAGRTIRALLEEDRKR